MVPLPGANQGFSLLKIQGRFGKSPDQLLVSTSDGVLRVAGDKLVPTLPDLHVLDKQAYLAIQSQQESQAGSSSGTGGGVSRCAGRRQMELMRECCRTRCMWRIGLAEDADGDLWVGGGKDHLLRIKVAPAGMRDSR